MIKYLTGRNRKLSLPNGEEHSAVFVIADLDDLKASHNEITFNNTPGYPLTAEGYNINDRNYKDDLSAQRNVQKIAENLDPEKLIAMTGTNSGTPIINRDGIVVSGNNRIMSLKLAVNEYREQYEAYKKQLAADADIFGFNINDVDRIKVEKPFTTFIEKAQKLIDSGKLDLKYEKGTYGVNKGCYTVWITNTDFFVDNFNESISSQYRHATGTEDGGKESALRMLPRHLAEYLEKVATAEYIIHPVLVRIDENLPEKLTTEDLAKYNQDTKKAERPVDRAVKLANILLTNERCRNAVLSIIDGYDTFSDFYAPDARNSRKKLIENFVSCGLITEAQLPAYYDNGEFTDGGKDFVEMLLSAIILTPDALKISDLEGVKRLRQIIIGSLPLLITNANLPDASLKDNVSQALVLQYKINQVGDFSDYMRSQSLFPEDKPDIKSLYINSLLRTGRNAFKNAIRRYNESIKSNSGSSLFGAEQTLTIPEIFDKTIVAAVDETDKKIISNYIGTAQPVKQSERPKSKVDKKDLPTVISAKKYSSSTRSDAYDFVKNVQTYSYEVILSDGEKWYGNAIDRQDAINQALDIKKTITMLTENDVNEIETPIDMPAAPLSNWFIGDNFFKQHPDKVLGEAYETSGRWGKVTKYKGDLEAIKRIDVSLDFIGNMVTENNALISTGNDVNISAELMKPEVHALVVDIVEKAERQAGEKVIRRHKAVQHKQIDENAVITEITPLQTFQDVWRTYNPEISKEELRAYIWYKTQIGKPLSRQWINLVEYGRYDEHLTRTEPYSVDSETIKQWVQNGLVFYYEGKLIPSPIYLSGNMYDKKMQLDRDKEEIITMYGQQVFEAQELAFQGAWRGVYDKRLKVGQTDNALVILPISKLSNEFQIKRIAEMPEDTGFKIKTVTAASSPHFGKPDWEKDMRANERDKEEVESLSLTDAFGFWLLKFNPDIENVTHLEVLNYYCYGKPIRIPYDKDDPADVARAKAQKEKLKASTQEEGEKLYKKFLDTQLEANDKIRLETQWNANYNNYLEIDFNKIPVAFNMCRFYKGNFEKLKHEKREAVAFVMNNGSGILSYDVGVGKTPSAIFTMSAFMDAGYSKRPLLVVPNQVYKQFISEIKNFAPHIPILEGYNFSGEYLQNFKNAEGNIEQVPEGVITVITYEGMENIGFNSTTQDKLLFTLYEILNQGGEAEREKSEKQKASFQEKIEGLLGKGLMGTMVSIEDFGFDFMCYDEAHKMKKVFTAVKGEVTEDDKGKETRGKNPYVINSGVPSNIALKGFMLNYYIQSQNKGQNVMMLTATPFTNSPLEIFSMLSMVGYEQLKSTDLNNIKTFFDTYVRTTTDLVINSRMKPQFKQVIYGFNNLISLQSLIRRFINYKTGEDVNVSRPQKFVLPYLKKIDDGIIIDLPVDERVETYISMTSQQTIMMDAIIAYVEGGSSPEFEEESDDGEEDEDAIKDTEAVEIDEDSLSGNEKLGVKIIKGITWSRNLALSPYLFKKSGLGKPTYKKYIETSPKLRYVMLCIKSVKLYHESKGEAVSGQVIYMDRGIEYFPLIKEYLVKEVGFKEHEIGIIKSGLPKNGKTSKEYIKNLYNGEIYNEATKMYDNISDEQRIKVIIGSSTIKEGINLQKFGTVLYNCFIDWNPTDIQQLEGRIWRQGNTFNSVRIVNPLVVDSADIFLFQKLQEKTSRLNTIWATDGKSNVLNTDELDPSTLKYDLIRDPRVIAELKSIDAKKTIASALLNLQRKIDIIAKLKSSIATINSEFKTIKERLIGYRNFESTGDKLQDAEQLVKLTNDAFKKQTDKKGHKLIPSWNRKPYKQPYEDQKTFEKRLRDMENASDLEPFVKHYEFAEFAVAVRDVIRQEVNFIRANEIYNFSLDNVEPLDDFLLKVQSEIAAGQEKEKYFDSKEFKDEIVKEAVADRESKKLEYKSVEQMVADFSRLNYLLSDKKVKLGGKPKFTSCPPMDKDGTRSIEPDALAHLDKCIASAGQTKDTYFDKETGTYTSERLQVHENIIKGLFENVKCVSKGAPIAVFTGGSPASGKTTFIKKIAADILKPEVFHLDADEIRSKLPDYEGWNANATHKETQDIVNELLNKVGDGRCRYDFLYDGTMNKAQKYFGLINKVKGLGYKTFIIFMDIPYAVARERALLRYKKSGRYVPMEVIDDFFKIIPDHDGLTMGQYALNELKSAVDGYIVIDGITGQIIQKGGEALPQERVYEGQAEIDFKKWKAGESTLPVEIIEPATKAALVANEMPKKAVAARTGKTTTIKKASVQQKEPTQQDILDTINGLQFLADDGDQDAIATIDGLKLLID